MENNLASWRRYRASRTSRSNSQSKANLRTHRLPLRVERLEERRMLAGVDCDDHGNDAETATPVEVPSTTPGIIETALDRDMFSFHAEAGSVYLLDYQPASGIEREWPDNGHIVVFDVDGTTPLSASSFDIGWTAPADGQYFVQASNYHLTEAYNFEVQLVDDDHGNSTSDATPVDVPSNTPSRFEYSLNVDVFSFEAEAGASYHISISDEADMCGFALIHDFFVPFTNSCEITIYDTDGMSVMGRNEHWVGIERYGTTPWVAWTSPSDATYFVSVESVGTAKGDYSLDIRVGDDHGDEPATATPLPVPTPTITTYHYLFGVIDDISADDEDWFSFQAIAGGDYIIAIGNRFSDVTQGTAQLYREQTGNNGLQFIDSTEDGLISFTPTTTSNYFLLVDGEFRSYGVDIHADLPCDLRGTFEITHNGCDLDDLDKLYDDFRSVADQPSDQLIQEWLMDASHPANPAKIDPLHEYVLGDLNLNGRVDSVDLGLLLNNFDGTVRLDWADGNLNSDAIVDSIDLGRLLNNFGFESVPIAATAAAAILPSTDERTLSGDGNDDEQVAPVEEPVTESNDLANAEAIAITDARFAIDRPHRTSLVAEFVYAELDADAEKEEPFFPTLKIPFEA